MSMCTLARGCYRQLGLQWHRIVTHKRNYSKQTSVASSARPCCVPPAFFDLLFKHVKPSLSHDSMVILQYKSHKPERKQVTRRCTHHGFPGKMGGTKTVGRLPGRLLFSRIPTVEPGMRKRARFRQSRSATSTPLSFPLLRLCRSFLLPN